MSAIRQAATLFSLLLALPSVVAARPNFPGVGAAVQAAEAQKTSSEFTRLAARLAQQRLGGADENENLQGQALGILDNMVIETLNAAGEPNLDSLNRRLGTLAVQQPPVGESYRVLRLGGSPATYALAVNFGLGGPSAVRLYAAVAGRYVLVARIDRFAQKDFFDEYLEVIPILSSGGAPATLFVTVTGRTDELQTGAFTVWRLTARGAQAVWTSEILQQSSYESRPDGFWLTYCAETDEDRPRVCRIMMRDRFLWDGLAWRRVERANLPLPKR